MDIQSIIVSVFLAGAVAYAGFMIYRKLAAFSPKSKCSDDCGCSAGSPSTPKR